MVRTADLDGADHRLRLAENAAAQAEQRDVQNLAIVSQAFHAIRQGDLALAQGYVTRVGAYARRMGLNRLEADVLLADSDLKLTRGEHAAAAESASEAIALGCRNGSVCASSQRS